MARTVYSSNIDSGLSKEIAEIAKALKTSKSQQVNLALEAALADMPTVIARVMSNPKEWSNTIPAAYTVEPTTLAKLTEVSATLAISKDALVKLAMRSYVLSKITSKSVENLQNTTGKEAKNAI